MLTAAAGEQSDWIEIRMLGPLRVRRADGTPVDDRAWRTGKNADLLRWLAVAAGRPVSPDMLAAGLWPDVDDTRARASLRTALSQLRRVLGPDVLERLAAGLVLRGVWVDAASFVDLAEEAGRLRREGRAAEALTSAREADALYLADVPVGVGSPEVIAGHAADLALVRRRLLGDAAEVAVELGWMRDAVDFALRLREADPVSERASRALMLGWAGMGELHHALAEFERCKHVLAEELGVDPSPQTRAVHLQVLRPVPPIRHTPPFVGRTNEAAWLTAVLADGPGDGKPVGVVLLSGAEGSGRRRLTDVVCQRAGMPLVEATSGSQVLARHGDGGQVTLWTPDLVAERDLFARLVAEPPVVEGVRAIVVRLPGRGGEPAWHHETIGPHVRCLELEALLPDEIQRLATRLLSGTPSSATVDELVTASGGLPGTVKSTIQRWAGTGRLVVTSEGLALSPPVSSSDDDSSGRRALARALPRLDGDALEAALLAAVLDEPLTPTLLAPLLPTDRPTDEPVAASARVRATAALDQLVDLTLLRTSSAGAVWRHPLLRDATRAWMRPAVRGRMHRRVAEGGLISSSARVRHWLLAGERELACVAALDAATECSARGDHAGARAHLLEVVSLSDLPEAGTEDQIELFEQLGDACALLRRPDEAGVAYRQALAVSQAHFLPDTARLRRKADASSDPRALDLAPRRRPPQWMSALADVGVPAMADPDGPLEAALQDILSRADRQRDQRTRVQARVYLASAVHLPRREFRAVRVVVEEAMALGPRPAERLEATIVRHAPAVLLGHALKARDALEEAERAAGDVEDELTRWRLLALRVLVAHDLGDPAFDSLWTRLRERVLTGTLDEVVPALATVGVRVLAERGETDLATGMALHLPFAGGQHTRLMDHVARVASADLADACGDYRHAADLLRSVVEEGAATRCTLMVPEAAARLVALEAGSNPASARAAFEVYDDVVGATPGPREEFWRRMARGAVRAAQADVEGAAASYGQASALATQHRLPVLAARARQARAEHMRTAGSRTLSIVQEPPQAQGGTG